MLLLYICINMPNSLTYPKPFLIIQGILLILFFCLPGVSSADSAFESLLMPGKLIKGHAKYEAECSKCHVSFEKKSQTKKCIACHKKIRKDIKTKKGFHGKSKKIKRQECQLCHTDHKGRDADVVKLDKATFDHQFTDFPLRGTHEIVRCEQCHKKKKPYRETSSKCHSCHKKASTHKKSMGKKYLKNCKACHQEKGWSKIKYDHDKTKFRLKAKHKKVDCTTCHPNDRYIKTPKACVSCHRLNDVHRGNNGKKCQKCHSPRGWKKLKFDHSKDTDFPLTGRHKQLICVNCHKKDPYKVEIKQTCISCHKQDDTHHGKFNTKCEKCHKTSTWKKLKFNHDKDTEYKLKGKHKTASCIACHKGTLYKTKTPTKCISCHKVDDVHRGQQGKKCQKCHNEKGWNEKVRFDHDLTRLPLIGLHATTPCEECHLSNTYKTAKIACFSCHEQDDIHEQRLGENCNVCHNPNGWKIWRFDHDKQTEFKLTGKHKKVYCEACHTKAVKRIESNPRTCIACHSGDDIHDRQFGKRCDRCHTTKSFNDLHFRN